MVRGANSQFAGVVTDLLTSVALFLLNLDRRCSRAGIDFDDFIRSVLSLAGLLSLNRPRPGVNGLTNTAMVLLTHYVVFVRVRDRIAAGDQQRILWFSSPVGRC